MFVRRIALPLLGSTLLITACTATPAATTNPTPTAQPAPSIVQSAAPTTHAATQTVAPTSSPQTTTAPAATPTADTASAPASSPITMIVNHDPAAYGPGTYFTGVPYLVPLTFSLPIGWETNMGGPYAVFMDRGDVLNLAMVILGDRGGLDGLYKDPCHTDKGFLNPAVGPTASDLATALAKLPNATASAVEDVTVGGYPAKTMRLAAPTDLSTCTPIDDEGDLWSAWQLPLGALDVLPAGHSERLWIVDAPNNKLLVGYSDDFDTLRPDDLAQVQGILDSIQIEP